MDRISRLIEDLHSPKSSKRYEACEWLRVAPDLTVAATEALEQATHDPDPEVAEAARHALEVHTPSSSDALGAARAAPSAPYPLWKTAIWFLGCAAYVVATASFIVFIVGADPIDTHVRGVLGSWGALVADLVLWVALLALAAWQLFVRGHGTAGGFMVGATVLAAFLSAWLFYAALAISS